MPGADGTLAEAQLQLGRDDLRSVRIDYQGGASFMGFVSSFGGGSFGTPIPVTLTAHSVLRGEDPHHNVRWADVSRVAITYGDGSTRVFVG